MSGLNKEQKDYLMKLIAEGKELPEDFKYLLFPVAQKEYELSYSGKMRKEDLLANEDGVFPVPLQIEKIFNGNEYLAYEDGWKNMIVFGDNLQFLKTVYENKDLLIKDRVKGKVKLIYIDPPFGTGDEYDGNRGQKGYSARRKGADFVEFIRRRLILAKELLADDGLIFVRQGYNFSHYLKVILDETFGKSNFLNEIIVNRGKQRLGGKKKYSTATDTVFLYSKTENYSFQAFKRERYKGEAKGTNMLMKGSRNPPERTFTDPDGKKVVLLPPPNQHWKFIQPKIDEMYRKGVIYLAKSQSGLKSGISKVKNGEKVPVDYVPSFTFDDDKTIDSNWSDISGYTQETGYPTENSEALLERVVYSGSKENDIVMDFFGGSGTTAAVAEKLGRRWIVCDIGKLSYFTMQKRILQIQESKSLKNQAKKHNEKAKSFLTCALGLYDLKKALNLDWIKYKEFVSSLFEIEIKPYKVSGFEFDGKKEDFPVKIWDYSKYKNSNVDQKYLKEIHQTVSDKISNRVYIVAPANNIDFLTDYYEIDNIKYYFLKIPYQVIRELHKIPFQKLRQPQSKNNVNNLDEAIGFHFIKQPEVKSKLTKLKDEVHLQITEFRSQYYKDEEGQVLENFETLSAVFIDKNYNGKNFELSDSFFANDLLNIKNKVKKEENEGQGEDIRKELRQVKKDGLTISFRKADLGKKMMVVYTDIYGNDFTEILAI